MKAALVAGGLAAIVVVTGLVASSDPSIDVPPGGDLQRTLDAAPDGASVRLASGVYDGPIQITKRVELRGSRGTRIVARDGVDPAITVSAPGVVISDVTVEGGWTGIDLNDAGGSRLIDVSVRRARAEGVRVYKASARLENVSISRLESPHAQGIEVLSAPDVVVRDSTVEGGKVGIVGHLSDVIFENNVVRGTSLAGIVIREMSTGVARENVVSDASGAGLYCGDMSRCSFLDNRVTNISAGGSGRSRAGWGLVVHYHSSASSEGDVLAGDAGPRLALSGSRMVDRSPLELGAGARAIWPGVLAALAALAILALCLGLAIKLVPAGGWKARPRSVHASTVGLGLLVIGLVVQTFHMIEHVIQFYRVRVDGLPGRGGLAGQVVDNEWAHFGYNGLVLVGLIVLVLARRNGWRPMGSLVVGDRLILAAVLLQSYHMVEHSAKIVQHLATGAKVSPGLLGNGIDLVLLHFGLNVAVYAAFLAGAAAYMWRARFDPSLIEPAPATSPLVSATPTTR
jgi:nitrous oxidase accessory protein NosD